MVERKEQRGGGGGEGAGVCGWVGEGGILATSTTLYSVANPLCACEQCMHMTHFHCAGQEFPPVVRSAALQVPAWMPIIIVLECDWSESSDVLIACCAMRNFAVHSFERKCSLNHTQVCCSRGSRFFS